MRAAATAVLVLALAPFLQACVGLAAGCNREESPEFSGTEEQITRNEVVAVLGEPIETIRSEDGRVDVYEYDQFCGGVAFLTLLPFPIFYGTDQMLTVEYGPDGSFVTAEVWPDAETPEDIIATHKRRFKLVADCHMPFSNANRLAVETQYRLGTMCPTVRSGDPQADPLRWQWMCLAANQRNGEAQHIVAWFYYQGNGPVSQDLIEAYKWSKLAVENGSGRSGPRYVRTRGGGL